MLLSIVDVELETSDTEIAEENRRHEAARSTSSKVYVAGCVGVKRSKLVVGVERLEPRSRSIKRRARAGSGQAGVEPGSGRVVQTGFKVSSPGLGQVLVSRPQGSDASSAPH